MKTFRIILALLLITVILAGCSIPLPWAKPTPTPEPAPTPVSVKLVVTGSNALDFIALTESGKYLICEFDSDKDRVYSTGDYTISDNKYVLGNDATLTFSQTGSPVTFTLKKNDGKEISGSANPVKNTKMTDNVKKLCRTWTITRTQISVSGSINASAKFDGCNLEEISDFARNQGMEIKKDFKGISINTITVMPTGSAIIAYSTGKIDVAECDFTAIEKGELKYSWKDESALGYELTNGTATVSFKDDKCALSVGAEFTKDEKKYNLSVSFVLEEKK